MDTRKLVPLICLAGLLWLAACRLEPEVAADISLVAATTTPAATATPLPALDVAIMRPTMTPLPTRQDTAAFPAAVGQQETVGHEPEVGRVNEWLNWFPPA